MYRLSSLTLLILPLLATSIPHDEDQPSSAHNTAVLQTQTTVISPGLIVGSQTKTLVVTQTLAAAVHPRNAAAMPSGGHTTTIVVTQETTVTPTITGSASNTTAKLHAAKLQGHGNSTATATPLAANPQGNAAATVIVTQETTITPTITLRPSAPSSAPIASGSSIRPSMLASSRSGSIASSIHSEFAPAHSAISEAVSQISSAISQATASASASASAFEDDIGRMSILAHQITTPVASSPASAQPAAQGIAQDTGSAAGKAAASTSSATRPAKGKRMMWPDGGPIRTSTATISSTATITATATQSGFRYAPENETRDAETDEAIHEELGMGGVARRMERQGRGGVAGVVRRWVRRAMEAVE